MLKMSWGISIVGIDDFVDLDAVVKAVAHDAFSSIVEFQQESWSRDNERGLWFEI